MSTEIDEALEAGQDDSRAAEDTIAAIATPPGMGGIGIVRISGPEAFRIGMAIFRAADAVYRDAPPPSHLLTYGHVVDAETGERIDEALAAFMRAPRTYTREDVVEISAHGGPLLLGRILRLALAAGARAARAGEMTLRAFLNGRLDLAQAEAVMALINAESDAGRRLALRQLQGELSARIGEARAAAMAALAHIEASIDFPEEEVPSPERGELAALVAEARGTVDALLAGAGRGRLLREGLRVALVGRPNVGKSSLLNALLRTERAIVTPIPGTTRDTVEERASIGGVTLHLVDTAGLTATDDPIERIGVERSRAAARSADLLLFLLDRTGPLTADDWRAAGEVRALGDGRPPRNPSSERLRGAARSEGLRSARPPDAPTDGETAEARPVIVALNKADLPSALTEAEARALWPGAAAVVDTSAVTAGGTEALERAVTTLIAGGQAQGADPLVSSTRHADALRRADEHLAAALAALDGVIPLELVGIDLRAALDTLGEITGETASADLLDRIFAEFCIGK